jgi:hypothetical protein
MARGCQLSFVALSVALLLVAALPLAAQTDQVEINGTVTDPSDARVKEAQVEVISNATGLHHETTTDSYGVYHFPSLPIGDYQLSVSKEKFNKVQVQDIELSLGKPRTIDVKLKIGQISDTVQVKETTDYLNRSSAEVGGLIEVEQIKEIPISGRNWASLMLLTPGAINYGNGSQRSIRFDGHSLDDNMFTFDGIDATGVQEQTQKSDARLNIALDAIAEFRVSTSNYTAEAGSAGGAQISVVSKSGTNRYTGSTFYALRNDALDARSPFDLPTATNPTGSLPPFTLNQFGGNFGGPIVKDKAFFFANYEGFRQSLGHTESAMVPNDAYRAQVLAKSPVLKPILDAWPTGGVAVDSLTNQVSAVLTNNVREDSGMLRFDYRFSDKTSMYARYNVDDGYSDTASNAIGAHSVVPQRSSNLVLQMQHTFSPVLFNEAKFGLNRAAHFSWGYGTAPVGVSVSGFDTVSDTSLDTEVGTTFSYIDNLTMTHGRHTLKAGVDIRRIRLNNSGNTLTTQSFTYNSTDSFINNKPTSAGYNQGEGVVGNRRTYYQGYFQDEFKALPNLTLNLGLRYEYYSVAHEILDRSQVVDIQGCNGFCPKGTPYYDPNTKDFGPRFGLAWSLFNGNTVLRTGYGIYYGGNQNDDFSDPAESAVPRYSWTTADNPALAYPLGAALQNPLWSPKAIDRHRKDLSYQNWNLAIQQLLGQDVVLQVGYVGSVGHHLFSKYTVNLIDPATGKRPLAGFSSFGLKANDGNDNFNALQASLQRRFNHGLLFQLNYQYAHAIGDASIGSGEAMSIQDMNCRTCDRSDTSVDIRHNVSFNGVYQLPFGPGKHFWGGHDFASQAFGGWTLAGIVTAHTGQPLNITISRSSMPDGNTSGQRPDLIPGQSIYAANQSITNWFNPAAFAMPANGKWGDLGRNVARGPGNWEIDGSLQKTFKLSETTGFNLRAAGFNLLNHPQWGNPGVSLGSFKNGVASASFGKITKILNTDATGSGAPRRVEFMMRLEF